MRLSVVFSALVAVVVGVGASLPVILAAAAAVDATGAQTASWITASCCLVAVTSLALSVHYRMPILTAWSTPGAALIAVTSGVSINQAVAAFFFAALLMVVTAAFAVVGRVVERIPPQIASAMLAGVLFEFVLGPFQHLAEWPMLVLPLVIAFVIVSVYSTTWSVLFVVLFGLILAQLFGYAEPLQEVRVSRLQWIKPEFDVSVLVGLGLPLYIVTMASQNLPGLAVLRAATYRPPSRSIIGLTGAASFVGAGFGAHATNLAAITAALCTGADAHPNKEKRWLCGPVASVGYGIFAVFSGSLVALFSSYPEALIATIAGVALMGPFIAALSNAVNADHEPFAVITTFVVTASDLEVGGIGSAFWGLCAGIVLFAIRRPGHSTRNAQVS